jgi:RNA polymerase sigma-70 factor (ECF subfamily)
MDDLQAVRRMKNGEIGGLESLVMHYQVRAVRAAFMITQDQSAAEDVVQDVFIRLYRNIRRFDEARPFEPYLMRSVVNAALNATRGAAQSLSLDADPAHFENLFAQAAQVESQIEFNQRKEEILQALSQLPPRQRAVIVQRYYLEMSEQEMSETLDSPPGTVKWLLNAARTRLRTLLQPERSAD